MKTLEEIRHELFSTPLPDHVMRSFATIVDGLLLHVQEQDRVISCMQNGLLQIEEDFLRAKGDIK